jgi:hypothetical protein
MVLSSSSMMLASLVGNSASEQYGYNLYNTVTPRLVLPVIRN